MHCTAKFTGKYVEINLFCVRMYCMVTLGDEVINIEVI